MKIGVRITRKTISEYLRLGFEYGENDLKVAGLIKKLCNWSLHPQSLIESPPDYISFSDRLDNFSCRNTGERCALVLETIDEIIKGHGTEAAFREGSSWPTLSWVNTGDAYSGTIVLYEDNFHLTTYGDMVEYLERRGIQVS